MIDEKKAAIFMWAKNNRSGLIKWLIIFALAIWAGTQATARRRFEQQRQALEVQIRDAEHRATEAEARAAMLQSVVQTKNVEIAKLEKRVLAADAKLRSAGELKKNHETIRHIPLSADSVSRADTCRELLILRYKCK
jgi:uncharacterized protein HemX